jgi:hypothetical protein
LRGVEIVLSNGERIHDFDGIGRVEISSCFHWTEGIEEKSSESGEARHECQRCTRAAVPGPAFGMVLRNYFVKDGRQLFTVYCTVSQ